MKLRLAITFGILILTIQSIKAQDRIKKDSIYFLLDTASIPLNSRMFLVEQEANTKGYILLCQCFPKHENAIFFYQINRAKTKFLSKDTFKSLKTISISELIKIVIKFSESEIEEHLFFFIEPDQKQLKINQVYLAKPLKRDILN